MSFSPLIRPLSPLQTQRAPSLPAPYNLTDAIFNPHHGAEDDKDRSSSPRNLQECCRLSPPPESHEQHRALTPPSAPAAASTSPHVNAPIFHSFITSRAEKVEAPDHGQRPNPGRAVHQLDTQQTQTPGRDVPRPNSVSPRRIVKTAGVLASKKGSQENFVSHSPKPPPLLLPPTSLSVVNPISADAMHPYSDAAAWAPSSDSNGNNNKNKKNQNVTARMSNESRRSRSHSVSSPPKAPFAKPAASHLLRTSTAGVAVAASQPSYGAALLRRKTPSSQGSPNFERRCRSSSSMAASSLCLELELPFSALQRAKQPYGEARHAHNQRSALAAAVGPTSDEKDTVTMYTASAAAGEASDDQYRGTAVSTRTGRLYRISIEASPLDSRSSPSPLRVTSGSRQGIDKGEMRERAMASALKGENTSSWVGISDDAASMTDEETDPAADTAPDDVGAESSGPPDRPTTLHATTGHATSKREAARSGTQRLRRSPPLPSRTGSPTPSGPTLAQPPVEEEAVLLTAPSLRSYYIYPALDECHRLLQEIQTQHPLLRRCLTPPRPLLTANSSTRANVAAAAEAEEHVKPEVAGEEKDTASAAAAAAAAASPRVERKARKGCLGPAYDARQLYDWDARAAAEDLSYMQGPFLQSSECFATATARQLQRLREVVAQPYGSGNGGGGVGDTKQTFVSSHLTGPQRDADAAAPMSAGVSATSQPHGAAVRLDSVLDDADVARDEFESPSGRLRRLLRETDAVFPVLWKVTHVHTSTPAVSPMRSEGRDCSAAGSGSGVLITPLPSTIQPSQGEKDGLRDEYGVTASVRERKSDLALSRLNGPPSLSSDELTLRFAVASLTPPRPLLPLSSYMAHGAGDPTAVAQRAE